MYQQNDANVRKLAGNKAIATATSKPIRLTLSLISVMVWSFRTLCYVEAALMTNNSTDAFYFQNGPASMTEWNLGA